MVVEANAPAMQNRFMPAIGVETRFVLPDISMPSCSIEDSWSRPVRRLLKNGAVPFCRTVVTQLPVSSAMSPVVFQMPVCTSVSPMMSAPTEEGECDQLSSARSIASSDSSILQSRSEHGEEDSGRGTCTSPSALCCGDDECDLSDVEVEGTEGEEGREEEIQQLEQRDQWQGGCVVEALTEMEMDYVERAHRNSRFLDVYSEPSLRFVSIPQYSFVLPIIIGDFLPSF